MRARYGPTRGPLFSPVLTDGPPHPATDFVVPATDFVILATDRAFCVAIVFQGRKSKWVLVFNVLAYFLEPRFASTMMVLERARACRLVPASVGR